MQLALLGVIFRVKIRRKRLLRWSRVFNGNYGIKREGICYQLCL